MYRLMVEKGLIRKPVVSFATDIRPSSFEENLEKMSPQQRSIFEKVMETVLEGGQRLEQLDAFLEGKTDDVSEAKTEPSTPVEEGEIQESEQATQELPFVSSQEIRDYEENNKRHLDEEAEMPPAKEIRMEVAEQEVAKEVDQ